MEEKIIFTTGGTGGHIYPALAIAKEFKKRGSSILFVGTKHRMEREIVPNEGYNFIGLDVLPLRSIKSFIKMLKAIKEALRIVKNEKPTKVIGFGNYINPNSCSSKNKENTLLFTRTKQYNGDGK